MRHERKPPFEMNALKGAAKVKMSYRARRPNVIGAFVLTVMLTTLTIMESSGSERSCRVAARLRDVVMKALPDRLTVAQLRGITDFRP